MSTTDRDGMAGTMLRHTDGTTSDFCRNLANASVSNAGSICPNRNFSADDNSSSTRAYGNVDFNTRNAGLANRIVHSGVQREQGGNRHLESQNLKLGCLNVRSLLNKVDQLQVFMQEHKFDILAVNETWLDESVTNSEISIPDCCVIRNDRKRTGGGVCLYVRNGIQYRRLESISTGIESLWLLVKMKHENIVVGTIYRPPSSGRNYYDSILDEIQIAKDTCEKIIILGDLNYDCAVDRNHEDQPINYIETLFDMKQLVQSPTRVDRNSSSLIDVILTSSEENHFNTHVIEEGMSDHYAVATVYKTEKLSKNAKHKTVTYRDYKNFDKEQFLLDLSEMEAITDLNFHPSQLEDKWTVFKDSFLELSEKHAPKKTRRLKDRCNPWITHDIVNLMYQRDYKKQQAVKRKDDNLWQEYTQLRNEITRKIRQARQDYYKTELDNCEGNAKKVWKFINKVTKNSNNIAPPDQLTADKFNDYFSTIGEEVVSEMQSSSSEVLWKGPKSSVTFKFTPLRNEDVKKVFKKFKQDSNTDILGFDMKLLHIAKEILMPILREMFNASLLTSTLPADWKLARVTPVYKGKGDMCEEGNYRPISVTGHISKIFESAVYTQLLDYFQENNYINPDQSAYRKFHNTQTALHRVTDDWIDNICSNVYTGVCSLDIKKCFDTIDHDILSRKLEFYGVRGNELQWFLSYLRNRSQVVRCSAEESRKNHVNIGVPQGSILGPLLFLIFVNDISQHVHLGTANLYADDTLIYCDGLSKEEASCKLQECIDSISNWYKRNNIVINAGKSSTMLVTSRHNSRLVNANDLDIVINDQHLENVSTMNYLGVEIDRCLTWNNQVKKVTKILCIKTSRLARLRKSLNDSIMMKIYQAFIQPSIDYALTVWGTTCTNNLGKIQRLQNYAARIIKRNFDYINVRGLDLVKELGWMNIKQRIMYFQILLMFKSIHGLAPDYLVNNVIMDIEISEVSTRRHGMNLYVPFPDSEFHKNILFYRGAKLWNDLPSELKDCHSIERFKLLLKNYVRSTV